jgi:hypothetical protein
MILGFVLFVFISLAAVGSGISDAVSDVNCNGHVMVPGEVCVSHGRHHRKGVDDYESQRAEQRTGAVVKIGLGTVFLGISAFALVSLRRRQHALAPPWTVD